MGVAVPAFRRLADPVQDHADVVFVAAHHHMEHVARSSPEQG